MKKLLCFLVCLFSGIAVGSCLLLPEMGPAVFFLAVPALVVIQKKPTGKQRFWHCYGFTAGICLATYAPAFSIQVNMSATTEFWIDFALYGVLLLGHGMLMAFALWLAFQLPTVKGCRVVSVALFWAAGEWLLGFGPFAWPTARVSLALWQYPTWFRSASFGGQLLVSALILGVNYLFARAICLKKSKKAVVCVGVALALVGGNLAVGFCYPNPALATTPVAVIQPGSDAVGSNRGTVYGDRLSLATQAAKEKPNLILLPEGIAPSVVNTSLQLQQQWGNIALQGESELLLGGFRDGLSTVIHFQQDGTRKGEYKKIKEVPFFENGQGKAFEWFPKGHSSILTTKYGKIGNLICYESMFSSLSGNSVKQGADLLFVSTNDSWFTASVAKNIHLAHGAYRSVETGRTLVQASMDGASAVFDATGTMTHSMPHNTKGVLKAKVSFDSMDTVYNSLGDWWLAAGLLFVILLSVWCKIQKRKNI